MGARCHRGAAARKRIRACVLLVAALVLGCAPESEFGHLDSSVTAQDLRQGKIAVLGVVKFQEPDQVRPPLIAMLEKTFQAERRVVPLIPADSVRQILGAERDQRLLLGYEYQGTLDPNALGEISDSLRGTARFLLLARVERERTRNSTRGVTGADTARTRANFAMGITGRDARVSVHLYDLTRRTLVANARYDGSTENEKPMLAPIPPGGGAIDAGPAVSPEDQGYPGVPELALALEEPFRAFARALPGGSATPSSAPPRGHRP
ncbi:MAG TPA: hypothetical protein VEU09_01275 [Candidatus Binatia bacterium]|nr:hypothetical protein [Candidatus Binatia bacterium]